MRRIKSWARSLHFFWGCTKGAREGSWGEEKWAGIYSQYEVKEDENNNWRYERLFEVHMAEQRWSSRPLIQKASNSLPWVFRYCAWRLQACAPSHILQLWSCALKPPSWGHVYSLFNRICFSIHKLHFEGNVCLVSVEAFPDVAELHCGKLHHTHGQLHIAHITMEIFWVQYIFNYLNIHSTVSRATAIHWLNKD